MAGAKKQNFLHGAVILTVALIVVKILGAVYKIPLGNILGDDGYGYFLAAYTVYNVFYTVSTAGVPVALSRLIAASEANERTMQIRRYFRVALITFFVVGVICSLVMFVFPNELATMIHHPRSAQSIWALAPSVLLCCMLAVYRGYFQGRSNMFPTAVSQVLEVLFKVIFGLALVVVFRNMGRSLPLQSAAAISGVTVGSLAALLYLIVHKRRNYGDTPLPAQQADVPDSYINTLKALLIVAIPISIGASVQSVINLIDTWQMGLLQSGAGLSQPVADVLYGVYGKAQTLYNLPATIISSLSVSVVPAVAAQLALKNFRSAKKTSETALRITAVLALPMAVGLCVLSTPIMKVIYWSAAEQGGQLLMILGAASFFLCMVTVMTGILQAAGKERLPVIAAVIGGIVKIGVNWMLISRPEVNIFGAAIGTVCCFFVIYLLDFLFMKQCFGEYPHLGKILIRPLISTAVMGLSAFGVYQLCRLILGTDPGRMLMMVYLAASIGVAVIVYLVMVIVTRSVTEEDMKLVPGGEKIAKILKMS